MRNRILIAAAIIFGFGILTALGTGIYYLHLWDLSLQADSTSQEASQNRKAAQDKTRKKIPESPEKKKTDPQKQWQQSESKLQNRFDDFSKTLGAPVGLAVAPMGAKNAITAGNLKIQVAWSTAKVPVAIAALNQNPGDNYLKANIAAAIKNSNNGAAEAVYQSLGTPSQAKVKIESVLRQAQNPEVSVPALRLQPGFTIFGQTQWSTTDQAIFAANMRCLANSAYVYDLMGQITPSQRWGLGQLPGARFKGGWGPINGGYLVRQFGVVEIEGQQMGVAIITLTPDFGRGTQILNEIANWLAHNVEPMPAVSNCQ